MNIPVDYNCLTKSVRDQAELEYRVLLSHIPTWRRMELESMEREFAEIQMASMNAKFAAHWNVKNGGK